MKKLLILAYDFPPYVSVGGIRPWNWFNYLKEFDVEPIVITRQWSNEYGNHLDYIAPGISPETIIEKNEQGVIYRTPYKPNLANRLMLKYGDNRFRLFRKAISGWFEFTQYLWVTGPKKEIYLEAKRFLKKNKVDAIIATGDPFVLFSYASKLSQQYKIPWIADYRDPWSLGLLTEKRPFVRMWSSIFERRIVKRANLITTVDQLFKNKISAYFPNKHYSILPNGFDPIAIEEKFDSQPLADELTIAHAGTIYNWQPIYQFLDEFSKFLIQYPQAKIRLVFYGVNVTEEVRAFLKDYHPHVMDHFTSYPRTENTLLLKKLKNHHVMLLFSCYAYSGTKVYDYLASKRKILFCFTSHPEANALKERYYFNETEEEKSLRPQEEIIRETNSGVLVKDQSDLGIQIRALYNEFLETGTILCESKNVNTFSRKVQVEKLADIINQLTF